jgi:N-acetylglutamate synthase-like GNAT family acetyltransferase
VLDYRTVVEFRHPFDFGNKFLSNSEAISSATQHPVTIRSAVSNDLLGIAQCIEPFVASGKVLPRTLNELESLLPHYVVAVAGEIIVGCAVLEIYSKKLAEIRSLVVSPDHQKLGLGKLLVEACIERAKAQEILEVMAITSREDFFLSCGFDFTLPGEKKALFYVASPHLLVPAVTKT